MMKAKYIRVSTIDQNTSRQKSTTNEFKLYEDKISGSTSFRERPAGKSLMKDIIKGDIDYVVIQSIDRLGRNVLDMQNQLNWFIDRKVQIFIENIQMNLLNENGSMNSIAKMIIDLLSSVASLELNSIKERQAEGIKIAKAKGNIYTGRKMGAVMSNENYFKRHKDVINLLIYGMSLNQISKITGKAFVTVKAVKQRYECTRIN